MLVSPEVDLRIRSSFALQTFMTTLPAKIAVIEVATL